MNLVPRDIDSYDIASLVFEGTLIQASLDDLNATIARSEAEAVVVIETVSEKFLTFGTNVYTQSQPILSKINEILPVLTSTCLDLQKKLSLSYIAMAALIVFVIAAVCLVLGGVVLFEYRQWRKRRIQRTSVKPQDQEMLIQ